MNIGNFHKQTLRWSLFTIFFKILQLVTYVVYTYNLWIWFTCLSIFFFIRNFWVTYQHLDSIQYQHFFFEFFFWINILIRYLFTLWLFSCVFEQSRHACLLCSTFCAILIESVFSGLSISSLRYCCCSARIVYPFFSFVSSFLEY